MDRSRPLLIFAVLALAGLGVACAPRHPPATAAEADAAKGTSKPSRAGSDSLTTTRPDSPSPSGPEDPGAGCPQGCTTPPAGCLIKGNINLKTGDRVYHVPGQMHYDSVTIETERGEKWFCTESEAQANGWRRAKR